MGVNLFVPVFKRDATPENIELLVNTANSWGDALDVFEWCDVFKGEGGHLLSLEQALKFKEDEAPWWVLYPVDPLSDPYDALHTHPFEGEMFWCVDAAKWEDSNQVKACDWRALLNGSGCDSVLLLKARN